MIASSQSIDWQTVLEIAPFVAAAAVGLVSRAQIKQANTNTKMATDTAALTSGRADELAKLLDLERAERLSEHEKHQGEIVSNKEHIDRLAARVDVLTDGTVDRIGERIAADVTIKVVDRIDRFIADHRR